MAFTYDDTLATDRGRVRFHLQDTVSGAGPKPGDANFTDDEIDGLLDVEGTWGRAVAAGLEALAMAWMRYPSFRTEALNLNRSDIAKGYAEQAQMWRKKYGGAAGSVGSTAVIRVDAYSDDVTSIEADG